MNARIIIAELDTNGDYYLDLAEVIDNSKKEAARAAEKERQLIENQLKEAADVNNVIGGP
jgi:hypothetical protein